MASTSKSPRDDPIWTSLRAGAQALVDKEPLMGGFVYATILNQPTFERALGFLLASKIANATILAGQWNDLIMDAMNATNEGKKSRI
mmetsp:Transcript_1757/g.6905  ORF Transcript_1757/g.6905 Transcript_1757/m.6905 type:complete len:87 (+) Transcript_1757:141-401(+)